MIQNICCPYCKSVIKVVVPDESPSRIASHSIAMATLTMMLANLDTIPTAAFPPQIVDDLQQAAMCIQAAQEKLKEVD